jgi:hypothetical protein
MLRRLHVAAEPHLSVWEAAGFEHKLMRLQTEIEWLDRLLEKAVALQQTSDTA